MCHLTFFPQQVLHGCLVFRICKMGVGMLIYFQSAVAVQQSRGSSGHGWELGLWGRCVCFFILALPFPALGTLHKLSELRASVFSSTKWEMITVSTSQSSGGIHLFLRTAVTHNHKLSSLQQTCILSQFWRLEV